MQVSTYEKQPSKSITLPKGQLTEKKIFFTSSQCKRHLNGKLSSRYLPSGFKSKVLQHSQERESDVFFTSCSQRNARDIGNFKQGYRKQKKIQTIDWATKPGGQSLMDLDNTSHKCSGYQMRMENRRQPHATVESKKKKIQTEKDMLRNHHHDTDRILSNIWYIVLWREMKKQAKKIADFKADADSSSYKAMSDEKQMIFHKSPKKSIQTHPTKRPSNSTRNKHEENFESEENLIFASSEGVKILSWDTVSYSKKVPATYVLSNLSSPKQLKDTAADKRPFDLLGTKRPSDSTGNNLEKLFVSNEDLAFRSSKGVEVNNESQKRYVSHKFESSFQATMNQKFVYKYPPTPPVSSNASILNQNRNNEEIEVTSLQLELQEAKESVAYRISLADIYLSDITGEKSKEDRDATRLTPEDTLSTLSDNWIYVLPEEVRRKFINLSKSIHSEDSLDYVSLLPDIALSDKTGKKSKTRYKEEWYIARKNKYELKEKVVGNRQGNGKHLVTSAKLHTPSTQDQIQDQGREATRWIFEQILSVLLYWRQRSNRASEDSADQPTHHTDTSSDDHHTTFNSQDEDNTIMPVCMKNENWSKVQAAKILSSEANTDASSVKSLSTRIRLYRNVIRNETYRMMSSINMVLTEAEQLFGPERSQILFGLLTTELCHFGSTGAIFEFVPNMTESTIRKTVISFFEHARDMMNILMTLFLSCPDGLQQMQVHNFISVMKPIIKSLLKTKTKGREKLTLKEKIKTVFDSEGFEIELGEEILKDFFNRYLNGEEKVVHSCTRLERHLPSDRRENRPILSIYFPSDCRLFIYIPTENGSYWHQLDMQRSDRISRHGK